MKPPPAALAPIAREALQAAIRARMAPFAGRPHTPELASQVLIALSDALAELAPGRECTVAVVDGEVVVMPVDAPVDAAWADPARN
jgi:hypothetical protein